MKLVVAFMAGIAVAHALVTCPDKEFQCPDGDTCCQLKDGGFGCCPMPSAVCCKDGTHCCPHGTNCNTEKGTCDSVAANLLMSVLKSQGSILMSDSFPATEVVESEPATEESFLSVVNVIEKGHRCNATLTCPEEKTCCNGRGRADIWGCCPWENGVCCPNMKNCCPEGTKCDDERKKCFIPTEFDSLLEKASEKQQKLVTSLRKKMVPATFVPRKLLPPFLCPAPSQTLCNSGGSELVYGCCPLAKAVCCPDHYTCCPSGMECATKGMCAGNRSVMVETFFRMLDSHTAIPRKWAKWNGKGDDSNGERLVEYKLLGDNQESWSPYERDDQV